MRETRTALLDLAEVRGDEDTEKLLFSGHAAVFNERTWIGPKRWGFWEEVDPGFFREVLDDDAAFLVNHDPNLVFARNGNTMSLTTDDRGLKTEAEWDSEDAEARTWAGRVRRGDVTKMSFAFTVREDKWEEDPDTGEETRTLLTADRLYDVSLVTYPAYEGTDGGMRDQAREIVRRHRGEDPELDRRVETVLDDRALRFRYRASRYGLPR
jgi:uncharacterized protein